MQEVRISGKAAPALPHAHPESLKARRAHIPATSMWPHEKAKAGSEAKQWIY